MANQHIVRRPHWWSVLWEWNSRDTSHHSTQQEAFEVARRIATNQGWDTIIHGRDGKIRERNTYGKPDYFPPAW